MPERAGLPATAHVGGVTLQIADLERSLRFYTNVIGLALVEEASFDGGRVARLGTGLRPLLELREKPGVRRVPPQGLLGLYHFAVVLPTRADLGRFVVHVAGTDTRFAAADHLFSEALYLTDPDGLQVEVYSDRPRSEWQYRNGEVVGDTLPLDLEAIVRAAGDAPWHGLPAGTLMGHVHLYVGDLATAREFYVTALGFTPSVSYFPGALFVAAGGYHHHVGLNTWAAGAPPASADDARLLSWELVLPDDTAVAETTTRLTRAGIAVRSEGTAVQASDPWNINVRLTTGDRPEQI